MLSECFHLFYISLYHFQSSGASTLTGTVKKMERRLKHEVPPSKDFSS